MTIAAMPDSPVRESEDEQYTRLYRRIRDALRDTPVLFTTDADGLYDRFLAGLPPERRQHYTCRACRSFVDRYGGLASISHSGFASSPLWDQSNMPPMFETSTTMLAVAVANAKVTGVFLARQDIIGLPLNTSRKSPSGSWLHLHVDSSRVARPRSTLHTPEQAMAEKREECGMLRRGLAEFPLEIVQKAHALVSSETLYRSEKVLGVAKWLLDLHTAMAETKRDDVRDRLVWRAVATAPPGFCHVRSTMIGTLLEDLAAGKPVAEVKRAFDAKMNPTLYQRPQAAPTDGQLAAAEAVVAKLASAGALARRFARLEEILPHAIWQPKPKANEADGKSVFGHLKKGASAGSPIDLPTTQVITWDKFRRTVLPEAERIELLVPQSLANFFAFVTAENPEAPPILQWDIEGRRNPVSWYVYHGGSPASHWALTGGTHADVDAITLKPASWGADEGAFAHHGDAVAFILHGARDLRSASAGLGLFPESLKSDYHGIRAAIEAYSRSKTLGGQHDATACGLALSKGPNTWNVMIRVTTKVARASYRLDRWD